MGWTVWQFDSLFTRAWTVWALAFLILETAAVTLGYRYTLTAHLRPLFLTWPILWFIGLGVWLWLGVHFLAPAFEGWLIDVVRRR